MFFAAFFGALVLRSGACCAVDGRRRRKGSNRHLSVARVRSGMASGQQPRLGVVCKPWKYNGAPEHGDAMGNIPCRF
jgi:hypothetical protein